MKRYDFILEKAATLHRNIKENLREISKLQKNMGMLIYNLGDKEQQETMTGEKLKVWGNLNMDLSNQTMQFSSTLDPLENYNLDLKNFHLKELSNAFEKFDDCRLLYESSVSDHLSFKERRKNNSILAISEHKFLESENLVSQNKKNYEISEAIFTKRFSSFEQARMDETILHFHSYLLQFQKYASECSKLITLQKIVKTKPTPEFYDLLGLGDQEGNSDDEESLSLNKLAN